LSLNPVLKHTKCLFASFVTKLTPAMLTNYVYRDYIRRFQHFASLVISLYSMYCTGCVDNPTVNIGGLNCGWYLYRHASQSTCNWDYV